MAMKDVHVERFTFNPNDNGGEQLCLETTYYDTGDGDVAYSQKLSLESYGNSASLRFAALTPEKLREAANLIEQGRNKALAKLE